MTRGLLDNPIWSSLTTEQAHLSHGTGLARRYEADVAPFAAVGASDERSSDDAARIVAADECVYFVGVPPALDERWAVLSSSRIVQMVWESEPRAVPDSSEIVPLTARDNRDMIALTSAVFPGFFRLRTREMGAYYGIRKGSVLAAMAGERMHLSGHQEISAVCTHPDFVGRGLATQLVVYVTNLIRGRAAVPFLHVGEANARARELYLRMGFAERAFLPMWYARRTAAT